MKSTINRLDDGTIELKVIIPKEKVKKSWEQVLERVTKATKVPGFRVGKAPKKIVEDATDKTKIQEEVLKQLLPSAYIEAIQEHNLKPIINPKIHVEKVDSDTDWEFTALTCEMPTVDLGNYKNEIAKITAKSKIIIPGKEQEKPSLDSIMKAILQSVKVTIPRLLLEHESDRLLAQTLDEIKRLGLSLDQYLSSTGKTPEQLREEYTQKAKNDITLEFALQHIADSEKIIVEEKEIDEAIQKAKDAQERAHLEKNRYLLASILRQQKTLDFLQNL